MERKRLFLTGAGGFCGHHFLEHVLTTTDWDVVATDSFRHRGTTDRIGQVLAGHPEWKARVDVLTHDVSVPFSDQAILRIRSADYMIAMASESHVDRSISDPVPFVVNNVQVILSTLELARELRPDVLVVISTDEVYGPVAGNDTHPEWSPVLPSNPYAASKAAQEALAISYWRTYGVPLTIVNCMNMVAERQAPEKYVPSLIRSVSRGEEVTVHGTPGHIGTRHYLHARNLADGVLFLLNGAPPAQFPAAGRPDRYNIVGPDRIDNLTLAQMVAATVGKPLKYRLVDFHSARPGHDPHYGLDGTKMAALGWKPPVPFTESLERTVRWTLANPEWL
jgi:dTDP-glucose 4,6-dehydratase